MFVILTNKPGEFHTVAGDGVTPVATVDYLFHGLRKATFVIAELAGDAIVEVVDEAPPPVTNRISTKFLEHFDTIEAARRSLAALVPRHASGVQLIETEGAP